MTAGEESERQGKHSMVAEMRQSEFLVVRVEMRDVNLSL